MFSTLSNGWLRLNIDTHRARACAAALVAAALLPGARAATAAPAAPAAVVAPDRITELHSATLVPPEAGAALTQVQLPYILRYRDEGPARASYRFSFTLPAVAQGLAVYVDGTNLPIEAVLNGREVYASSGPRSGRIPLGSWRAAPAFRLPTEWLVEGVNQLELKVLIPGAERFAIGTVSVGPPDLIAELEEREWLVKNKLPQAIAAVLGAVAFVALALWRGRREYVLFFWLGSGACLWSLQNLLSQMPFEPLPQPHLRVLVIGLYVWFPLLLAIFFMRFAYHRSMLFERFAITVIAVTAPVLYAADALGVFPIASRSLRLATLVCLFIALGAVMRFALRSRDFNGMLLLTAGALCVAAGVYDYAVRLSALDVRRVYLTTYSGGALLLLTAWILLDRYQKAYKAYRDVNRELEERVRAANLELHKRLEQTQAAREQAEQANAAKTRFFAAASHDLRQPLHSLGLFASALDDEVVSTKARDMTRRIVDSVDLLGKRFDELLDLSRLDSGAVPVRLRNVDLQATFDRMARDFHPEAVARELRLRFMPTGQVVRTDDTLFERILSNLVSNALRYTKQGGVVVGARRRGERVLVEVWDTGVGVAPEQQQLIFEEFYQVDNPGRDRRHGQGLGLAIVRRLAALLDIRLSMRSVPGRGTRFRLEVPRSDEPPDPLASRPDATEERGLSGLRVLVVDDDPLVREGMAALLGQWRAQVRTCASARESLEALQSGFDAQLLIVDLRLGTAHDGIAVIDRLRASLDPDTPAILISGDTAASDVARARASGIPWLTKPVPPAKLRSLILSLLRAEIDEQARG